jgi:hypothetical protein
LLTSFISFIISKHRKIEKILLFFNANSFLDFIYDFLLFDDEYHLFYYTDYNKIYKPNMNKAGGFPPFPPLN